ncbi:hypothetical protein SDC9_80459 [bioreactor metagenome]|uniref:Uncharacterized protein n=1 Tax=bioreactor metagenome TaxID=1076179 RepID=A0A644Z0Q6_9ZZZZ
MNGGFEKLLAEFTQNMNAAFYRRGAIAYVQRLRREAQEQKRAYGQPRNPFRAVPGMEKEFQTALNNARYCDFILNELEKKPRRKREIASFFRAVADRYLDYLIMIGMLGLAGAGVTILSIGIGVAFGIAPRHGFLALAGVLAVTVTVAELWKRKRPRK